ncbi:hypothetical protein [Caulobacter sp. NIBR2454]|uniref:hypothetical protein n=1 Tax=Caulobacter sp. NIBR2454 TaxID=3015996 RepID=UPI0022B67A32|nr:hypothetical protein [Caulobacter sp. NIBR2454]
MKLFLAAALFAASVSSAIAADSVPKYAASDAPATKAIHLPADPQSDILRGAVAKPDFASRDHRIAARLQNGEAIVEVGYHKPAQGELGGKFIAAWTKQANGAWALAAYADNPAVVSLHEQTAAAKDTSLSVSSKVAPHPAALDDVYVRMRRAYVDLDGAVLKSVYAPDGWYISRSSKAPVESAQGAFVPGVSKFIEQSRSNGTTMDIAFRLTDRQVLSPNVVVDAGYVEFVMKPGDGKPERRSTAKFLTVLTRQADGGWAFWADTASDTPAENWARGDGRAVG